MSGAEIMAVIGCFVTLFGFIFGLYRYVEAKIVKVRDHAQASTAASTALASLAREELAAHKVPAAETFATKAGMQEQTAQIMRAIEGVGNRIDGVHERLDRLYESPPVRRASRT